MKNVKTQVKIRRIIGTNTDTAALDQVPKDKRSILPTLAGRLHRRAGLCPDLTLLTTKNQMLLRT